ncbi:uncharacterized protein LOC112271425 [Brachypodium distachyon]|uniref:uncharacterized protein LOC112271425 n=1 Tax=Brachypodium distachyon TaxID=15368 RepID=UPI000D0CDE7C|nr:uncharacterized protein LOC112271425 [Brachypodium distachyon]|eukprot:XP_024316231.1 uncharacterized protein LOC112271425 [Brachypodium distachyon]
MAGTGRGSARVAVGTRARLCRRWPLGVTCRRRWRAGATTAWATTTWRRCAATPCDAAGASTPATLGEIAERRGVSRPLRHGSLCQLPINPRCSCRLLLLPQPRLLLVKLRWRSRVMPLPPAQAPAARTPPAHQALVPQPQQAVPLPVITAAAPFANLTESRPRLETCIISRTAAVDAAETALSASLVVHVVGGRGGAPASVVRALIQGRCPLAAETFSLHKYWPANFLCICNIVATRDAILAMGVVQGSGFSLSFSRWNRQLGAKLRPYRYRVHVEMTGVPAHAWITGTAESILGPSCWVERLGSETANREDMGRFSIVAWTDCPDKISREFQFGIPEPPAPFGTGNDDLHAPRGQLIPEVFSVLYYPVVVHLLRVEDRDSFTDVSSIEGGGSSSNDDSNDPRRDPGGGPSACQPRSHYFKCRRGVVDGAIVGGNCGGAATSGGVGWSRMGPSTNMILPVPELQVPPLPDCCSPVTMDEAVICMNF